MPQLPQKRVSFPFLPKLGGHSWTEVQLEGEWKSIDSYIDDQAYYQNALLQLKRSGRALGYSVSFKNGKSSCEFNFGEQGFLHMGAMLADHGAWKDSAEYFATSKYPRMSTIQLMLYPMLVRLANRNIAATRQGAG